MGLRVVGAGLGRTGTSSLKLALEYLLDAPCYHMTEMLDRPDGVAFWLAAAAGEPVEWERGLARYVASVDWPAAAFWPELSAAYPEALVLLSLRPAGEWYESAARTIYAPREQVAGPLAELSARLAPRFPIRPLLHDRTASMALHDAWNDAVRAQVPAERLVVWQVGSGWEPLCAALGVPVPDLPFPHANTKAEFIARWVKAR